MDGEGITDDILSQLHPLEIRVLPHLKDGLEIEQLAKLAEMKDAEVTRAVQWLENKGALKTTPVSSHYLQLGANAIKALEEGLPEQRFLKAIRKGCQTKESILKEAELSNEEFAASIGILKGEDLLQIEKGKYFPTKKRNDTGECVLELLGKIEKGATEFSKKDQDLIGQVRKRKDFIISKEKKTHEIKLTPLGEKLREVDTQKLDFSERLTREDLETGSWKDKKYRSYDVSVNVPAKYGGKIHFVQEALDQVRRIWLEMGFAEMRGTMTQSAFWDLDALFVPQDHPAREMQDTFYLKEPSSQKVERAVYDRVRDAHEHGGRTGSKGWRYDFSREESERLLLRTHTTVLSAQTLWKIKNGELPYGKYFTVGKVFRNEKVDWKHLFEFNQVEGIVVDKNVNFAQLLGYLRTFFAKMGYPNIRCRPSHFPYTEPSVELDVWHPKRKQWVELGGAGVFRPEVTHALLGEDVPVLAWGPGFERVIVEYFEIADLRDLYRNDIQQLRNAKRFLMKNDG